MNLIGGLLSDLAGFFNGFSEKKEYINYLIKHSDACSSLTTKYYNSVENRRPIMTYDEYKKELIKIVSDPNEEKKIITSLKNLKDMQDASEKELVRQRIVGYKYEESIFEMFDTKFYLSHKEVYEYLDKILNIDIAFHYNEDRFIDIIKRMRSIGEDVEETEQFREKKKEAELRRDEVFNIWINNCLIERSSKESGMYEVGVILTTESFSLDKKNDLTRGKWLAKRGKKIIYPEGYINDDLPF